MASMDCGACGSGHTEAMFDTYGCLDCGAQTSFTGEVVREPTPEAKKGSPNGQVVLDRVDADARADAVGVITSAGSGGVTTSEDVGLPARLKKL